jgi:hypothetical protein
MFSASTDGAAKAGIPRPIRRAKVRKRAATGDLMGSSFLFGALHHYTIHREKGNRNFLDRDDKIRERKGDAVGYDNS